jgi:hypothetical protein
MVAIVKQHVEEGNGQVEEVAGVPVSSDLE